MAADKQEPNVKASAANITDQERDWAQQALAEYDKKNYKACLQHLDRIAETRPKDPKVLFNRAVVEYYDAGLCTTDRFQKSFVDVCKQVRGLVAGRRAGGCRLWTSTLFPRNIFQVDLNLEQLDTLEDVENCIYYYNYAVLLYHLKHYTKALAVITKVYSFIESLGKRHLTRRV